MTDLVMQALALILVAALSGITAFFAMSLRIAKTETKVDLLLKMVGDLAPNSKDIAVLQTDVSNLKEWKRDMRQTELRKAN